MDADEAPAYEELKQYMAKAIAKSCPPNLLAVRDDLVQAALMKVMMLHRRGEGKEGFSSSYLWRVAHSALVDEIRRHRRKRESSLDDEPWKSEPTTASPDPEARAMSAELGFGIKECLKALVRPRRLAVTLHLQGHTVPEMATLLGWDMKRADNLLYRGLKGLRNCLQAKGLG